MNIATPMAECILTDVTVRVEDRVGMIGGVTIMWIGHEAFVQLPGDLRVNREPVTFVTGMRGALLMIINENRQTTHYSHCSNLVLDDPIVTICADRDPCRCPCHKLLTALDMKHGRVFLSRLATSQGARVTGAFCLSASDVNTGMVQRCWR